MKKIMTSIILALATGTLAAQPIDFTQTIKGLDGKAIVPSVQNGGDGKTPVTLSDVCVNALESQLQTDAQMSGQEKFKLDQLAHKIYNQKHVDLSIEEIALIKERVGKVSPTIVVGAVWGILDPPAKKE